MESAQSIEWDRRLKKMFDEVDDFLEDKYGHLYRLHPNRLKRGETSNKEMDGLFNIGASFSPGYGTEFGRGYVIDLHLSTLAKVEPRVKNEIELDAISMVKSLLSKYFPKRELDIKKDGTVYKLCGDLSLGTL
ncbi:hypothetical protein EW093_14145 [Thiospirochaeta perfilievii]|uniref:Uncharacterized protein n=1 Tax=Thiospirochaeta perfilievii TaxID=252967 RepID=A0A5C1QCG3_9SPIO|nr:hypothetical protein [Thiospirochaeta perfilievii]QEN05793.1 hypothetical protein EW093_14145 [Thiospirochaeta perfilievii]